MSTFDSSSFLNTTYTGATATSFVPVPEGIFNAVTLQPDVRQGNGKDGKPYYQLILPVVVDDAGVRELLGRDEVRMTYRCFLDVENGVLAQGEGRNVHLGRLRTALGLNNEGEDFTLSMLSGRGCKIDVKQRVREESNEIISDIAGFGAL